MDQITIDARFDAIEARLAALEANAGVGPPLLAALVPETAEIGDPSFTLRVLGANFKTDSVIVFAGQDEPTTRVSPNELTTGVDMSVWLGPDPAIAVKVRDGSGLFSNALPFAFTATGTGSVTAALEHRIAALEEFERRIADLQVEP